MRDIKKFLKKLDLFGVNLNFKYQANDTYTTSLGELFILIFGAVALGFGIYYFIPFIKRKNLSIIYYTMNIPKTEQINLKDSKAAFSIGFQCDENENFKVKNIFDLQSRFVIYTKDMEGKNNKKKEDLSWHYCEYQDFYNEYNDSMDYLGLNHFQCLDDYERSIEGIFSDQIFSYYEFAVMNKNKTKENFNTIYQYLSQNDCKLVIYYTDITIDLTDYKEPIKPFLNSIFIQLNPTLDIKRNIYFMNQYLFDDDFMFAVFSGDEKPKQIETLFSRYEEYALYVGLDFNPNNVEYAKVFIRADTKKTTIKRTYQKVTEFYADASSLLIALYEILIIIFSYINNFYAEQSITKRLFFFKELDLKGFKNPKRYKKILELMVLTGDQNTKNMETIQFDLDIKNFKINSKRNNTPMNIRKNKLCLEQSRGSSLNHEFKENTNSEKKNNTNRKTNKIFSKNAIDKGENNQNISQYLNSGVRLNNFRKNHKKEIIIIDLEEEKSAESKIKENKENKSITEKKEKEKDYSFNVFEIFCVTFCKRYIKGRLKLKHQLNEKANELLYYKLDIHAYLRNMFLFDIINQTIIDGKKKYIINFLSRPLISIHKKEKIEEDLFYKDYEEIEFDKLYEEVVELAQKNDKEKREEKLINLANKSLKDFI